MKTIFTQLLRFLLRVRRPKAPARRLANSASANTTLVAISAAEPVRRMTAVSFHDVVMLVYALGTIATR